MWQPRGPLLSPQWPNLTDPLLFSTQGPRQTVIMSEPDGRETAPTAPVSGWVPEFGSASAPNVGEDNYADSLVARSAYVLDGNAADARGGGGFQVDEEGQEIQRDWEWVEDWRAGGEPTPWGPGITLAAFAAAIVSLAIYVITAGLIDQPILAIVANVVIAGGLSPALYMARTLPVLRWVSLGGAIGSILAWIAVIFFPVMAAV